MIGHLTLGAKRSRLCLGVRRGAGAEASEQEDKRTQSDMRHGKMCTEMVRCALDTHGFSPIAHTSPTSAASEGTWCNVIPFLTTVIGQTQTLHPKCHSPSHQPSEVLQSLQATQPQGPACTHEWWMGGVMSASFTLRQNRCDDVINL